MASQDQRHEPTDGNDILVADDGGEILTDGGTEKDFIQTVQCRNNGRRMFQEEGNIDGGED